MPINPKKPIIRAPSIVLLLGWECAIKQCFPFLGVYFRAEPPTPKLTICSISPCALAKIVCVWGARLSTRKCDSVCGYFWLFAEKGMPLVRSGGGEAEMLLSIMAAHKAKNDVAQSIKSSELEKYSLEPGFFLNCFLLYVCMCVRVNLGCLYASAHWSQKRTSDPIELELQLPDVGAQNKIQVLLKDRKHS